MKNRRPFLRKFWPNKSYERIISNLFWAVLGRVVGILNSLFIGILVARYLGAEQYGLMNYAFSYVTLFSILASFGLDSIEIRELSKTNSDRDMVLGTAFFLRLCLSLLTVFLLTIILFVFEKDSFTVKIVLLYSITLFLSSFNVIRNYFTSIVLNKFIVISEIIRTLIGAGIKIYLLLQNYSLIWFIAANVFESLLIVNGYLYSYQNKADNIRKWKYDHNFAIVLIKESFPLLLSGMAVIIYQRIDQVMIRNMISNAALGNFSVGVKINELTYFVPTIIAQTITPFLVKARQKGTLEYVLKRQKFMDIMVWGSIFLAVTLSLGAKIIVTLLFGEQYLGAIPVLQIMAWQGVFISLFAGSGQIIIIENLQKYAVSRNLIGCFISILMNLILIPRFGIVGAAAATLITMSFSGYFSHLFIKPYRFLFPLQTYTLLFGWKRLLKSITENSSFR